MKTILLIPALFLLLNTINAQDRLYEPFKLDLAIGLSFPTGDTYLDERFSFAAEPKYSITDQIALGLRLEISPYTNFAGTSDPYRVKSVSSFVLTADYYFNKANLTRPFFGLGAGVFNQILESTGAPENKSTSGAAGIVSRLGVETKHFRAAVEYNATFFEKERRMNYITLKVGAFLWGARKHTNA